MGRDGGMGRTREEMKRMIDRDGGIREREQSARGKEKMRGDKWKVERLMRREK